MGALERYIFRQAAVAFLGGLTILTLVVWVTQVLRQLDLVTNSGQTIALFVMMTALGIPFLVMLIAPISLFIAIVQTLNKLSSDSELIVMSAAGVPPHHVLRPFIALTMIVTLLVGLLSIVVAPASIRVVRSLLTQVQANLISAIVKPGQFTQAERGLTFHVRDRAPGGILLGIIVSDTRDPEVQLTYIAARGTITEHNDQSFFVLEDGNLQRRSVKDGSTAIVVFDRYAYDLTLLSRPGETIYRPSERYITELINPNPQDPWFQRWEGRFRQELHDRFAAPLYPLALMCIAFAMLGHARTTRQSRATAIAGAIGAMALVRGLGFAVSGMVATQPWAVPLVYLVPLGAILFFGLAAFGLVTPRLPQGLSLAMARATQPLQDWFAARRPPRIST